MNPDSLIAKLKIIFTISEISRIDLLTSPTGEVGVIIVDVHGLTCHIAERFIRNIVNICKGSCNIKVIHGYRHGTRIKDMLRQKFLNPNVKAIIGDSWNFGVTYLQNA